MTSKITDILKTKKFWYELFIMTFGMCGGALAVHCFLIPNKLIIGSISGLSIVLNSVFGIEGFGVPEIYFLINVVLLVLAYILIGPEFGLKTVYTSLIMTPWLMFFDWLMPIKEPIIGSVNDPWWALLCFILVLSFGQTILFRINASTGGLDIIAKIINKYTHISIGTSVSIAGALLCSTAFFEYGFKVGVYGLIGTWINGLALNYFSTGMVQKKRVCVISRESERIKDFIINEIGRGVSLYQLKGGYTSEDFVEVVSILEKDEFFTLMQFIEDNNIGTFMTSGDANEIYGTWNKRKKMKFRNPKKLNE